MQDSLINVLDPTGDQPCGIGKEGEFMKEIMEKMQDKVDSLDVTSSQAVSRIIYDISCLEIDGKLTIEEGDDLILRIKKRIDEYEKQT